MVAQLIKKLIQTKGFVVFLFLSFASQIATFAIPYLNGLFLDVLGHLRKVDEFIWLSSALVVFGIAAALLSYFAKIASVKVVNRLAYSLLEEALVPVVLGKRCLADSKWNSYTAQRLVVDSNVESLFVISLFPEAVLRVLTTTFVLMYVSNISRLLLVLIIVAGFLFLLLCVRMRDGVVRGANEKKSADASLFQAISLIVTRASDIQMGGWASRAFDMVGRKHDDQFNSAVRYQRQMATASSSDTVLSSLFQAAFFLATAESLLAGKVTIGQFVSTSAYFNTLLQSLTYLYSLYLSYLDARASSAQMNEYIQLPLPLSGSEALSAVDSIGIAGRNQAGSADVKSETIIVKKGEILVIVGPNGAGKSTLLNAVAGLVDSEYEITYNYKSVAGLDVCATRKNCMSVLGQDSTPYNCSVSEYLEMVAGVPLEEQIDYLTACPLSSVYSVFSDKLEQSCEQLSGGEFQILRLCIALSKKSDVLILDEPTVGLDNNMVLELCAAIEELRQERITLIVTHDEQFARNIPCHIVVMEKDEIAESWRR